MIPVQGFASTSLSSIPYQDENESSSEPSEPDASEQEPCSSDRVSGLPSAKEIHLIRADIYFRKASHLFEQKNYVEATECYLRAQTRWSKVWGDRHLWIALCFECVGNCFFSQEKYSQALCCYEQSLKILRDLWDEVPWNKLQIILNICDCHFNLKNYDSALPKYLEALEIFSEMTSDEHLARGQILSFIGKCYLEKGNLNEARHQFCEALKLFRLSLKEHDELIVITLRNIESCDKKIHETGCYLQ